MTIQLTRQDVRRLAIRKQHLSGPLLPATSDGVMRLFRALGCVQLDPIRAVECTQFLVLRSRLGVYDRSLLHQVQFEERQLFEYWAHAASIVLAEHYPLHRNRMNRALTRNSVHVQRAREWMETNAAFRQFILDEIREKQPVSSAEIDDDRAAQPWVGGGWTTDQSKRSVTKMIEYLWTLGEVTVGQREGTRRLWSILDDFVPAEIERHPLDDEAETAQSIQVALGALGVATKRQVKKHFTRGSYPTFAKTFKRLEKEGVIMPVEVLDSAETWYMLATDESPLREVQSGRFNGRLSLLSPFDNLICDRDRTEALWDFYFRIEIYVPKAKRQYGYYVLPILLGDRLIGRVAPRMDRKSGVLNINGLYAEPDAPRDPSVSNQIHDEIERLAVWIGAGEVRFNPEKRCDWNRG